MATDERGASAVELALLFPVTLFVVLAIVQFGLWYHGSAITQAAAQQGVRDATAYGAPPTAAVGGADQVLDDDGDGLLLDRRVEPVRSGAALRITVQARVLSIVPLLDLPVRATAQAPLERFLPSGGGR